MSMYADCSGYNISPIHEDYDYLPRTSQTYWPQQPQYSSVSRGLHPGVFVSPHQVLHGSSELSYNLPAARSDTFNQPPLVATSRSRHNSTVVHQDNRTSSHYTLESVHPGSHRRSGSGASQSMVSPSLSSMSPGSPKFELNCPVYERTGKNSGAGRYYCLHSDCADVNGDPLKSFSRNADLARHEKSNHGKVERLDCPRRNCNRKGENGFTRSDHLVEHRRGYHGESIPKRQRSSGSSERAEPLLEYTRGYHGEVIPARLRSDRYSAKAT